MQWIGNGHFAIFPRQTSRRTRFSLHESFGQILHYCPSRCASTGQNDWTWTQQVFRIIGQNRRIRSKPQYKIGTSAFFLTFFFSTDPLFLTKLLCLYIHQCSVKNNTENHLEVIISHCLKIKPKKSPFLSDFQTLWLWIQFGFNSFAQKTRMVNSFT